MNLYNLLLVEPLANGLVLSYKILGQNMGLAIIAFSLLLRLALTPLTQPYMNSMKKMREYQKDIEKLKKRHQGDKKLFMKAQADFYKEKGINPGAGCLPFVLQIVVLLALFRVFTSVLSANGDTVQKFNQLLYPPLRFSENQVINTRFLYLDITKPDVIRIPGVPFPLPGLLIFLAAFVQLLSAKMSAPFIEQEKKIAQKTSKDTDDLQVAMQSSFVYTFPLMTLLIGIKFPSGLALYWFLFSAFQLVQQYRSTGWGGATPWLKSLGLIKLPDSNGKTKNRS